MWIDSDIRFLHPHGFMLYIEALMTPRCSVVAVPETEPAYTINQIPNVARVYHTQKYDRLRDAFGEQVANYLQFTAAFNAGLFSAPANSPLWARWKRNLEKTFIRPHFWACDQDSMLVSIIEVQDAVRLPSVANWLCSLRSPVGDVRAEGRVFVNPENRTQQILVAHLTNSSTHYNFYQELGLTT
jgi:hypothetical protein